MLLRHSAAGLAGIAASGSVAEAMLEQMLISRGKDPNFRNLTKVSGQQFDRLVRNVYKVLLTRGMIGTVIYSHDSETRAMLRDLAGAAPSVKGRFRPRRPAHVPGTGRAMEASRSPSAAARLLSP
jgi:hypothetical protein